MTDIVFHSSRNSQAGQGISDLPKLAEGCEGCPFPGVVGGLPL